MQDLNSSFDISVIIPSYNISNYIERCVQSALNQKDVKVEVIVIDDNSTDSTLSVLSQINDSRLKIVSSDKNYGPGAARNTGIKLAQGKWVAIVDGDDIIEPTRLARMLKMAHQNYGDMVVDNQMVHREADGKKFPMFPPKKFATMQRLSLSNLMRGKITILKGHPLSYVKPIVSKSFLIKHQISYNEDIWIGEDYLFIAEILASGAVCIIDPALGYEYTVRKGSISYRMSSKDMDIILTQEQKFLEKFDLDEVTKRAHKKRMRDAYTLRAYFLMVERLKQKDFIAAIKIAIFNPHAAIFFWEPVWVRIRKLF